MLKLSRLPNGDPEIFVSIQGEGVTAGTPSVFVRLALCNLRCDWCDTKYTWDWERYNPEKEITALEIQDVVRRVHETGISNVVVTGGEPLLQQHALTELIGELKLAEKRVEIETNGTFTPDPGLADRVDQWNTSPKLANSGNPEGQRHIPEALAWFARQSNAYFKFVVVDRRDTEEIAQLVARYGISRSHVLLMPEGQSRREIEERSNWLIPICCEEGYRFSTRLHVLLWGTERCR